MSEIEKMKRYIERTKCRRAIHFYTLNMQEIYELRNMADVRVYSAIGLAFNYGRAKGYRAAKAEGKAAMAEVHHG